jgi:hypothetical protein
MRWMGSLVAGAGYDVANQRASAERRATASLNSVRQNSSQRAGALVAMIIGWNALEGMKHDENCQG